MKRRDEQMINQLKSDQIPEIQRPSWLNENVINGSFPFRDILNESVFYPASGLDSDPIMHLGHYFWSFVYADYGYTPESILAALDPAPFMGELRGGYSLICRRSLTEDELPLTRWNEESSCWLEGGNNREARERATPPFAEWALLERNYGSDKPRELMSLLFVGADGVTLFKKLYVENKVAPACIAIIQPGDGMGDQNWTDFSNPNAYLAQAAIENPAGSPRFLLYGGNGRVEWYKQCCWSGYDRRVAWPLARRDFVPGNPLPHSRDGALGLFERIV